MVSYFDAHCDTIYRCQMDDSGLNMYDDDAAQRMYYSSCDNLGQNGGHIDLIRAGRFSRYAQFFALFADSKKTPDCWLMCRQLHDCYLNEIAKYSDKVQHCKTAADVDLAVSKGKCAALLSIEGADLLNCDLRRIETVASWGVRFLNPVWNRANALAGTNCEDSDRGLTEVGREFICELERNDIFADVSHLSDAGFWDLVGISNRPIVASHSNSRTLCPHQRNITDDMFRAIRDSGGVVGINLYREFVGDNTMDTLLRHVEHFLELGGEYTVCIGGDLDGCEILAGDMKGIEDIPNLYEALRLRGYDTVLLENIFWNNLHRLI